MKYETDVDGKAFVRDGMLIMDGNHPAGKQKIYISSRALTGTEILPERFTVRTRLGGQSRGAGNWNVGVSVGNVRMLFHPGYSKGYFRVSRASDGKRILPHNYDMGFTPKGGQLYEMTINVARDLTAVRFDVVIQGDDPRQQFRKSFVANANDAMPFDRISLDRSGSEGGAAMFDSLSIEVKE